MAEAPAPSLATLVTVPGPGPLWPACRFVARDPSSPSLMTLRPLWFDESAETETARMYAASYKKCQLPESAFATCRIAAAAAPCFGSRSGVQSAADFSSDSAEICMLHAARFRSSWTMIKPA